MPSLASIGYVCDLDKTLTADDSSTVYEVFNEKVCDVNSEINRNYQFLKKCVEDIDNSPSDIRLPSQRYSKQLRICGFNRRQYIEAGIRTGESKNIKSIPYAFDAFLEQQKLNCFLGICTGSPKFPAKEVSIKKIGIKEPNIAASEPVFDNNGNFLEMRFNLGTNKIVSMGIFHLPKCYCNFALTTNPDEANLVYTTDDLSDFEKPLAVKIGSQLGAVLYVGEELFDIGQIGEFVVNAPEIRKDLRKVNHYLDLYRRARIYPYLHDPKIVDETFEVVEEIKHLEKDYGSNHGELLDKIFYFLSLEIMFPSLTTRVLEKYYKLKNELDKVDPYFIKDLIDILKSHDPAFHATDKRKVELKNIIASLAL